METILLSLAYLTAAVLFILSLRGLSSQETARTGNLYGILGIDEHVRNGFSGIQVRFEIDADASEAEIKALVAQSQKRSAVFDLLTNPTSVVVTS